MAEHTAAGLCRGPENTERKALFFDVDGTLLSWKTRTVPKSACEAIARARELGHLVFVNSGRTYSFARFIEKYLDCDGYLCGCGTEIYFGETPIYQYLLQDELLDMLREDYKAYGVDIFLEGPEGTVASPGLLHEPSVRIAQTLKAQGGLASYAFYDRFPVNKFCMQGGADSDLSGMLKKYGRYFNMMDQHGGFYECVPRGHDKGTALLKTLGLCGIPLENAYAFGDSLNDLEVMQAAKNAVLMEEHSPELEPYASFITKSVENDGILYAMRELGII